jgi:hypothetical protein
MAADDLAFPRVRSSAEQEVDAPSLLLRRVMLKPYGDAVCTAGAAFWIFCARIAIFIMASAEAVSWSYLGYYIGQSSQPYVTAALVGLAVFSVIWIIDASFITLDTSRSRDEEALYDRKDAGNPKLKLAAGLLVRTAIICATLMISAPFLAQLVFFRDISAEMKRRDAVLISERRAALASSFDTRFAELATARRALDSASIAEAAGTGASRRMGRGPAVATIERRQADVDRAIEVLRSEKAGALQAFDTLDRAELQKRYGLQFGEEGIRARAEILGALQAKPAYANAELAIRAFLGFLFLSLMVLKLFQPASVSLYFSETMQDLYAQYRGGAFDPWLSREERTMTPLQFREWCHRTYRRIRSEDDERHRATRMSAKEEELRSMRDTAHAGLEPLRRSCELANAALSESHAELHQRTVALDAAQEALASQERSLEALGSTIRGGVSGDAFVRAIDVEAALQREVLAARSAVRVHEGELAQTRRKLAQREAQAAELQRRLESASALANSIEAQLAMLMRERMAR